MKSIFTAISLLSLAFAQPIEKAASGVVASALEARALFQIEVYSDGNFGGRHITLGVQGGDCKNVPADWNDIISSWRVPSGVQCNFYMDGGCTGSGTTSPSGSFGTIPAFLNDNVSSLTCWVV